MNIISWSLKIILHSLPLHPPPKKRFCIDKACKDIYTIQQPPPHYYVGAGGGQCKPGFMSIDVPEPYGPDVFITGEIFMRQYHTIFDRGSETGTPSRVCVAKNKSPSELEQTKGTTGAPELSDAKILNKVFLTRHARDEPFGAGAYDG